MITKRLQNEFLICAFLFIWPFIFLFRHTLPGYSWSLGIGNDFKLLYYDYKVYLLDHLSSFHFPLWSPSEASGYPFWSNPFTQSLYSLNPILTIFYKANGGYSIHDHEIYTISGLGIFAIGLYLWLRSLGFFKYVGIITTIIFSISFKVTELIRFPNAVHTCAWIPFILLGVNIIFNSKYKKIGSLVVFISLFNFITAGYPYFAIYLIFLVVPYILYLILFKKPESNILIQFLILIIPIVLVFIISLPYLLAMKLTIANTTDRGGGDLYYSTKQSFSITDSISSLIFPPGAQAEGWFYFGQIPIYLIIIGLIFILFNSKRKQFFEFVFIIGHILLLSYFTYGRDSLLFLWFWKNIPIFSSLRVWGRMNIVLVPLFSMLFSISLTSILSHSLRYNAKLKIIIISLMVSTYFLIYKFQMFIIKNNYFDAYWTNYFSNYHPYFFVFVGILSILFIVYGISKSFSSRIILVGLTLITVFDIYYVSGSQWSYNSGSDLTKLVRNDLNISKAKISSFSANRNYAVETISLDQSYHAGYVANWYFKRYINFLKKFNYYEIPYNDLNLEQLEFLGINGGKKLFYTKSINHNSVKDFIADSNISYLNNDFRISFYNGEILRVNTNVKENGYLSFIDNWDEDWCGYVDGTSRELNQLFGTFKSIRITPQDKLVEFVYKPSLTKYINYSEKTINVNQRQYMN